MKSHPVTIVILFLFFISSAVAQELTPIHLPPPQKEIGMPLMQALNLRQSSRDFAAKPLPLQEISNLLWAADGINRPESGKRTAPSAMNWQEMDLYVALPEGVFLYDPASNDLNPVVAGDVRSALGTQSFVATAPLDLAYVADYARVTRGSDEDKTLYTAADAGFIAENVYLYCASQGLAAVVRGSVDRALLAKTLKLRPDQKIILTQTVGYGK